GDAAPSAGPTELSLWYHGAGNEVERAILLGIISDFNASQSDYQVVIQEFPQESYNASVVAAALAGNLPDIIDVDGPIMPNWAWAGYLAPLSLSEGALDDFLPGTIGMWDGEVYSVGLWDAAVAMYARQSV
ncbi:extracellular solute-binding protein, partial [Arthrospira platensis SPKY2]